LLFSQGDFANAADELAAGFRSPLALRQLQLRNKNSAMPRQPNRA